MPNGFETAGNDRVAAQSTTETQSGASNVFSEFASSAYRSAVARPLESIKQLVGMKTEHVETNDNVTGSMKIANIIGNATGQIVDFMLLNKVAGKALGKGLELAPGSTAASALAEGTMLRSVATAGTVGFVNGSLLTPLKDDESGWRRLGNGVVDAGSFAALGAVSAKYANSFSNDLIGRAQLNALSGAAGGAVDSVLNPLTHGQGIDAKNFAENTVGWAVGNLIAGESLHQLGKGFSAIVPAAERSAMTSSDTQSGVLRETQATAAPERMMQATDAVAEKTGRDKPKLEMASMREIADRGDLQTLEQKLDAYYPQLEKAFPLPGEIETKETYMEYLTDKDSTWEMEHLLGKDGTVQGGLQYQVLDVNGDQIQKAGWLEHIWVDDGARKEGYGSGLLEHVKSQIGKKGGDATFWEFNNPDKMTPDEILEDAKGGITTQDRVDYWAKRGAYVLRAPSTGEIVEYAQPGMDGQEPVKYLSLAWDKPGGLDGQKLSKADYEKVLLAAHDTIVDTQADPTVKEYLQTLRNLPDQEFEFVRLSDHLKQRADQLQADHEAGVNGAQIRRNRWIGADINERRTILELEGTEHPNPEVVKAQQYQEESAPRAPWNRTAAQVQRFDSLNGERSADVVVVGGGVVGLQTAHELGSHGISTIVLDKGLVGSGTSRFMGAMGTYAEDSGFKGIYDEHGPEGFAKRLQALIQSRESVQQLARRYGADWRDVNSYNVSYEANDPALKEEVDLLHRFGDQDPKLLTGGDASQVFAPAQSIIVFPGEGNLNPYKFSLGLANSGKFAVHENSPVLGISVGKGANDPIRVFTPDGMIETRNVVFATNHPAPMFNYLNDHLIPVQTFATTADIGQKMPGNFFDTDTTAFTYWRQFGLPDFKPNEALVGGTARFLNTDAAAPNAPRLQNRIAELFGDRNTPDPLTALIYTAYSDGLPVAGQHPRYPHIWTATGAGGTGLVNGNMIGRTIRQQLANPGTENLISPERFTH